MRTGRDAGILIMMIAMFSIIAIVGGVGGSTESAQVYGIGGSTTTSSGQLIASRTQGSPGVARGRSAPGLSLLAPADNTNIDALDGQTQMSWWFSGGHEPGAFELRQGTTVVEHVDLWNDVSVLINNSYLRAGTYSWCVTVIETVNYQETGENCRTIVRAPAHRGRLSSVIWRANDGTFSGFVSSTVPSVRVKVVVKKGSQVVSHSKWITVRTMDHGSDSRYSYRAPIHASTSTKRLAAFITVSGGGVTQTFRNDLVNHAP